MPYSKDDYFSKANAQFFQKKLFPNISAVLAIFIFFKFGEIVY